MTNWDYFNYLKNISIRGRLYKKLFVYPIITRKLSGRVLDVGCGIGLFLEYREHTIGLDINPYNVEYCRGKGLEAHLITGTTYPFDNESFDGALLDNVLEHLEKPDECLRETRRVLRKRGRLVVGVPGRKGFQKDPDHKQFYDAEALIKLLAAYDFIKETLFYSPFRSSFMDKNVSAYALYGCFSKMTA